MEIYAMLPIIAVKGGNYGNHHSIDKRRVRNSRLYDKQRISGEKVQAQHDETIALIKYQIAELSDRVDKHNNLIERTYKLEQKAAVYEEKYPWQTTG